MELKNFPKIFIIILNYNGKDCVRKALASVFCISYPNFEVVVVDNASQDGSCEMVKQGFPKIALIKNTENIGFAAGNNLGIKYSLERGAKYILLLNNDTLAEKDFLSPLITLMEENEKVGLASPLILEKDSSDLWFSGGKIDWLRMKTLHEKNNKQENYLGSDFISGCSMLIRATVFKKIGLLDENFFLYWEDADFSVRAKKAGYQLAICPESHIRHFEMSTSGNPQKNYWLVLSGLLFFKKNSPFWLKPWFFFFVIARKIKNWLDVNWKRKAEAKLIQKAYRDFKRYTS